MENLFEFVGVKRLEDALDGRKIWTWSDGNLRQVKVSIATGHFLRMTERDYRAYLKDVLIAISAITSAGDDA